MRRDGESVWGVSASLLLDKAGRLGAILALVTDITTVGEWNESCLKRSSAIEFLATLAHELRNPLPPIRNAVYILQKPDGDDPAARSGAFTTGDVEGVADHLVRLVDDLLGFPLTNGKSN